MSTASTIALVHALDRIQLEMRLAKSDQVALKCALDRAEALGEQVARFGIADLTCVWHIRKAEILLRLDQPQAAAREARAGADALGGVRQADLLVDARVIEARALDALMDWQRLDRVCRDGIAVVERYRDDVSAPYLRAGYMRNRIHLYALGVKASFKQGDLDSLICRAELSKCRLMRQSASASGDLLVAELRALSTQISETEAAGRDATTLQAKRRVVWDRYVIATAEGSSAAVQDLASAQAALAAHEAVLYHYWLSKHDLLRLVIGPDAAAISLARFTEEERHALDLYAQDLGKDPAARADDFDIEALDHFTTHLWPKDPASVEVLAAADRLILSPHRVLHALPFAALRVAGRFVIERWSLRHAPNLGTLVDRVSEDPRRSLLAVGINAYAVPGRALTKLRQAEAEAQEIAESYAAAGWTVHTQLGATSEDDLTAAARKSDARVLHLACHAESVSATTPMESHLYLSQTRLDGLEIPFAGLSARTIVLSACSAGQRAIAGRRMPELPGDDLHGLQAAFFSAGAREIIATLFAVNDDVARFITAKVHARLLAGDPADIALARALRCYLAEVDAWRQPAGRRYWAPFFLVALGPNMAQD
ncbi:MAG: CHAT domain-containing protein [Pseudomonadota bacterium]